MCRSGLMPRCTRPGPRLRTSLAADIGVALRPGVRGHTRSGSVEDENVGDRPGQASAHARHARAKTKARILAVSGPFGERLSGRLEEGVNAASLLSFNTPLTRGGINGITIWQGERVFAAEDRMPIAAKNPCAGRQHRSTHERALALQGLAVGYGRVAVHDGSFQEVGRLIGLDLSRSSNGMRW